VQHIERDLFLNKYTFMDFTSVFLFPPLFTSSIPVCVFLSRCFFFSTQASWQRPQPRCRLSWEELQWGSSSTRWWTEGQRVHGPAPPLRQLGQRDGVCFGQLNIQRCFCICVCLCVCVCVCESDAELHWWPSSATWGSSFSYTTGDGGNSTLR